MILTGGQKLPCLFSYINSSNWNNAFHRKYSSNIKNAGVGVCFLTQKNTHDSVSKKEEVTKLCDNDPIFHLNLLHAQIQDNGLGKHTWRQNDG